MTTPSDDPVFPLTPVDEPLPLDPDADVEAAVQSALAGGLIPRQDPDPPTPIGKTWQYDFEAGQLVRGRFGVTKQVGGAESLAVWAEAAIRTPRYGYAVFTDNFGMVKPQNPIGLASPEFEVADYEKRMADAVVQHDRVSSAEVGNGLLDPRTGVFTAGTVTLVTDEEDTVVLTDISIVSRRA